MSVTLAASNGARIDVWREDDLFHAQRADRVSEPQTCLDVDLFEVIAELAALDLDDTTVVRRSNQPCRTGAAPSPLDIEIRSPVMSYLLVSALSLTFLFLWSKLPDPRGRQPDTVNSLSDRDDTQSTKANKRRGVKLHPDEVGEPDEDGHIRIGVNNWLGPDPAVPGYLPCRIDLDHNAHPPRVVTYEPQQVSQLPHLNT